MESSMSRLLLALSEQTCAVGAVEKGMVFLARVQSEDERVSFIPSLAYNQEDKSLSLSLGSIVYTMPSMVHCKMYRGMYHDRNLRKTPDAEAHVFLQSAQSKPNVLTLYPPPPPPQQHLVADADRVRRILVTRAACMREGGPGGQTVRLVPMGPRVLAETTVNRVQQVVNADGMERVKVEGGAKTITIAKSGTSACGNVIHRPILSLVDTVTIIFMVYDVATTRPTSGLGICLNQARLLGDLCDVKLVVDGVELDAHRTVLAARSPVLNKMLTGDYKEAREGRVELDLDGTSPAALRAAVDKFLEYLYTDRIQDWGDSEIDLLRLADLYMVPELRADCEVQLWGCDCQRALQVLHAVGLNEVISRKLRRRLTATVVQSMWRLRGDEAWDEFEKTYPVIVDSMFSMPAHPPENFVLDWSL
ncbi:uncharacterized protein LOC113218321 [Frankliniella occidentalis]|uniref:Uncharacterized protein LOC113218321 n=1 Tax=Frankliniella occidentalis TaxID=133901 RepID=A0A9C6TU35_FRAOC|nr:uncharacterized protein LOC113218321 [Frankliniella occidentalis]